ncbi:MAG: antitoxin PHD [Spirochaetes bacterium]|nr:MAG: antitoxin PHD [Spirochaetota bacterium]
MPVIKPSSELRNKYNEISDFCHKNHEPVYITKNGKGDLAVLSIEAFEELAGRFQLHKLLSEGLEDIRENRVKPMDDFLDKLENDLY